MAEGELSTPNLRVIGVALKKEKWAKHINQSLLDKAREAGFFLKKIDQSVPLEQHGRLDAVLQKLRMPEWEEQLERFAEANPGVKVFDLPSATLPIRNRGTMLTMLEDGGWVFTGPVSDLAEQQPQQQSQQYRVCVPTNTTLREGTSLAAAVSQLRQAGLHYPLLAKPVWADGREGSHALAVVGTDVGLQRLVEDGAGGGLSLPVLVQQYVDHGSCLFKVYVLGGTVVTVKRSSLQLPSYAASSSFKAQPGKSAAAAANGAAANGAAANSSAWHYPGSMTTPAKCRVHADVRTPPVPDTASVRDPAPTQTPSPLPSEDSELPLDLELVERVSAYPRSKSWGKWDLAPKGHGVASPPTWLIQELAQRLRRHLGLNLFNFDVIVPLSQQQQPSPLPSASNGKLNGSSGCGSQPKGHEDASSVYYVIDINYFPGYEKLPGYEDLMVQFLSSIWQEPQGREAPR